MRLMLIQFALTVALIVQLRGQTPTPVPVTDPAKQAFDQQMKLAQTGDVPGMYQLCYDYLNGLGVTKDLSQAFKWAMKCAQTGNPAAENVVGVFYLRGYSVPIDLKKAVGWLQKAADQGDPNAECCLGYLYQEGKGVPVDNVKSAEWFKKAAILNDPDAECQYGDCLLTGRGVTTNLEQAFAYYMNSSQYETSRERVAFCYENGYFVQKDPAWAYAWYLHALEINPDATTLAADLKAKIGLRQVVLGEDENKAIDSLEHGPFQTDLQIQLSGGNTVTVPFEHDSGQIVIKVRLNGNDLKLIMDTGATKSMLDETVAQQLHIKENLYISLGGTGADLSLGRLGEEVNLSLGGLAFSNMKLTLYPNFDLDEYLGERVDGILGNDVLRQIPMKIDFVHKTLTFYKPGTFKPTPDMDRLPITVGNELSYVKGVLGTGPNAINAQFLFDTGDGGSVTVSKILQNANPQFSIEHPIKTGFWGIGGITYTIEGAASQILLGKTAVERPLVTLPTESQGWDGGQATGGLGYDILKRFDITLDCPDLAIYLTPNANFSETYLHDNLGIGIKALRPLYRTFPVYCVTPDRPGALAGLKVGDLLTGVDGVKAGTMNLHQFGQMLEKIGTHRLQAESGGTTRDLTLKVIEPIEVKP